MRHQLSEYELNFEWNRSRVRLSIPLIMFIYGDRRRVLRVLR